MKNLRLAVIILLIVSSGFFASAAIIKESESFTLKKDVYGPRQVIEGSLKIGLANESAGGIISLGEGNNISLLSFLNEASKIKKINFSCIPSNCERVHEATGGSYSKRDLSNSTFVIGPIITGRDIELKENVLGFALSADGSIKSCGISPVSVDILDDGSIDWQYLEPSEELCGGSPIVGSCYDIDADKKSFDITTAGYCEKINLPVSAKFKLYTMIKKNQGNGNLVMFLYDRKTGVSSQCDLSEPDTSAFVEQNCMVDFLVPDSGDSQDYYVCIKDDVSDNAYSIQGETAFPFCGYAGLPSGNNATVDFALFVSPTAIASFNMSKVINATEFGKTHDMTLSSYLQDYISKKYDGDCLRSCAVPIRVTTAIDLAAKDFFLSYCFQGGICQTTNNFFDIVKKPSIINMETAELPLIAANFSFAEYGEHNATLQIGQEIIGSKKIIIEKVPVIKNLLYINPQAAVATFFLIDAYSPKNNSLAKYELEFGDGSSESSPNDTISHIYTEMGAFNVKATVTDSEGLSSSKTFQVSIGSPRDILNRTIASKKSYLQAVNAQIAAAPSWYGGILEKEVDISGAEASIKDYENQFKAATSDTEYVDIMAKVKSLAVPSALYDLEVSRDYALSTDVNDISPEYVEKIGGGLYSKEDTEPMRDAIWNWQGENLAMVANSRIIGAMMDDGSKRDILTLIDFSIIPKVQNLSEVFFIIALPPSKLKFSTDYGQKELENAVGFDFKEFNGMEISFAVYGEAGLENLVAFAAPYLTELPAAIKEICNSNRECEPSLGENWKNCRHDCKPIGWAIFFSILALIFIGIIYIVLQRWYKTKYESYLFKNRMDLVNITVFTKKSLDTGMNEMEVREKLKNAGWTGEQIDYCFESLKGKRIGLPSIKFKFPKLKKKKEASETKKFEKISNFRTIPKA